MVGVPGNNGYYQRWRKHISYSTTRRLYGGLTGVEVVSRALLSCVSLGCAAQPSVACTCMEWCIAKKSIDGDGCLVLKEHVK